MKTKIKKIVYGISSVALFAPMAVLAQLKEPTGTQLPIGSISAIVTGFMNWILILVGVVGVIAFAIAGILYLTAAGNEERIKTAKRAMMFSIVGVIVALLGLVILRAAQGFLGGNNTAF